MSRILRKLLILISGAALILVLFLWFWSSVTIQSLDEIPQKSGDTLRILMANVNYRNIQKETLTHHFIRLGIDVGVILEWTGTSLDTIALSKAGYCMPVHCLVPRPSPHGIAVFVKDTLQPEAEVILSHPPNACRMPMATLRIHWQDSAISLIGLHTPPPLLKCYRETPIRIDEISDLILNGRLIQPLGVCRPGEVLLIAGDLNMPPFHPSVKKLGEKGFIEAYSAHHRLPAFSWSPFPWLPAMLRLDYLYCTNTINVIRAQLVHIPGSDHKGIIVDIQL